MSDLIKDQATDSFIRWRRDPSIFVREIFGVTPDGWQDKVLKLFPTNPRVALKASKGVGKTALLSWIAWNFLLTRKDPLVVATSISADVLADNLWTEMARWLNKSPLLQKMFTWQKTKIFANDAPETWYMTARCYPKTADPTRQGDALAGLHAKNILFLLDESGGMNESIIASAEAALSTCQEGHIIQAGNPTHLEGALYRACTNNRKLWEVIEISSDPDDPNRSNLVSKEWARQQIELYGKDNPFVLVNVFGQFPPASLNALIGYEEVQAAMNRDYKPGSFSSHAKIFGVDVARFGADSSIIFPRQGLQAFIPFQYRNLDGTQGASQVARKWQEWEADAVFIDDTGGFGASWIDNLKRLGFAPIGVHFASKATDPKFANKRSEMMHNCVEWIKGGGALPKIPELTAALTQTTYSFNNQGLLIIEPKDAIKLKLGYSPDHLDALCFEANTLISTPLGDKKIASLKIGDEVLTPFGRSEIVKIWVSETDRITTVNFSNNKTLRGKGAHKIFTWNNGQCRLDALKLTDKIETIKSRWKWQILKLLTTKTLNLEFKVLVNTINLMVGEKGWKDYFIGVCGLIIMEQFPRNIISIIKMVIGVITTSPIWSVYLLLSIIVNTLKPILMIPQMLRKLKQTWINSVYLLKNGMDQKKVKNGIKNMLQKYGIIRKQLLNSAQYVTQIMKLGCPILCTVQKPVKIKSVTVNSLPLKKNVYGAMPNSWQTNTIPHLVVPTSVQLKKEQKRIKNNFLVKNVPNVLKSLYPLLKNQIKSIAPLNVVTKVEKNIKVYNLTLKTDNAYYANGILVYNCLTFSAPVAKSDGLKPSVIKNSRHTVNYDPLDLNYIKQDIGGSNKSHTYEYDSLKY